MQNTKSQEKNEQVWNYSGKKMLYMKAPITKWKEKTKTGIKYGKGLVSKHINNC